jgi:hypothetical protein
MYRKERKWVTLGLKVWDSLACVPVRHNLTANPRSIPAMPSLLTVAMKETRTCWLSTQRNKKMYKPWKHAVELSDVPSCWREAPLLYYACRVTGHLNLSLRIISAFVEGITQA